MVQVALRVPSAGSSEDVVTLRRVENRPVREGVDMHRGGEVATFRHGRHLGSGGMLGKVGIRLAVVAGKCELLEEVFSTTIISKISNPLVAPKVMSTFAVLCEEGGRITSPEGVVYNNSHNGRHTDKERVREVIGVKSTKIKLLGIHIESCSN